MLEIKSPFWQYFLQKFRGFWSKIPYLSKFFTCFGKITKNYEKITINRFYIAWACWPWMLPRRVSDTPAPPSEPGKRRRRTACARDVAGWLWRTYRVKFCFKTVTADLRVIKKKNNVELWVLYPPPPGGLVT